MSQPLLAAPDQKVPLLVIPGWADAVLALLVLWSPQEPKQSLLCIRKEVFPCNCSRKTNADLEMRMCQ